jgi:hypothetical protein
MAYITVCLDHPFLQVLSMYEPECECVKCNGTMPKKAEGGEFWCSVKLCCVVGCTVFYVPSKCC